MSFKRKMAIALWGTALAGGGAGYWFNTQGNGYADDYEAALVAHDATQTQNAYDNTQSADLKRNVGYGVSLTALVAGAALWFWPED